MTAGYSAQYTDEFGTEPTTIFNDGRIMKMTLREVEFAGDNFYSFSISSVRDNSKAKLFNLIDYNYLCGYSLDCQIPVLLTHENEVLQTLLHVHVECGKPVAGRNLFTKYDRITLEILRLEIEYQEQVYRSGGRNLYNAFDQQLTELRNSFPAGVYLKTCWNCAFSDYHPIASGSFGYLGCFKYAKNEYRQVKDKQSLIRLWHEKINVQEIFLCSEFEKRQSGAGGLYVG